MNRVEQELDLAVKFGEYDLIWDFIPEIKSLVEKFSTSGQSGFSAHYTAKCLGHVIEQLCLQNPIVGIREDEDDWFSIGNDEIYQHKRCSSLFKKGKSNPCYLDAVSFVDETGISFSSSSVTTRDGTKVTSMQTVKFPFMPKTFYVDVVTEGDKRVVRDESQLEEVFRYYYDIRTEREEKIDAIVS
jgi:hypothetical protein